MSSVTQRISKVKQPYGGYIKPSMFAKTVFDDGVLLNESENIHATVIGIAVDYMTRFMLTGDAKASFRLSIEGYKRRARAMSRWISDEELNKSGIMEINTALTIDQAKLFMVIENDGKHASLRLLEQITGLDDDSIIAACKLATYDVWRRNILGAIQAKDAKDTNPDKNTIENIRTYIRRSLSFLDKFGPITANGFVFAGIDGEGSFVKSGYTDTVDSGDGDFLTNDTIWDFKVSKANPTSKHTLQLLMYYVMGKHSGMDIFRNINKLGFFNPKLNTVYILEAERIPPEIIRTVEEDIICY